jgi:hypothetical protein
MSDLPILKGIIHGRVIELDREPGLPDGQEVTVTVEAVPAQPPRITAEQRVDDERSRREKLPPGEGIRRSSGGWAEDAGELDEYLEWVRQQRKVGRREPES